MSFDKSNTALVITDPQNDFLSPDGVTWKLVGASAIENRTVENLEQLISGGKAAGYMFSRAGTLDIDDFDGSGADWVETLGRFINDGAAIVTNPEHSPQLQSTPPATASLPRVARGPMDRLGRTRRQTPQPPAASHTPQQ
ncbi:MAG: cysteine hydrolase [bacterium]|nr:cysteine hydrolase [bacterium]